MIATFIHSKPSGRRTGRPPSDPAESALTSRTDVLIRANT